MATAPLSRYKRIITNTLGLFAYTSLAVQWVWSIIVIIPLFLTNKTLTDWFTPQPATPAPPLIDIEAPSPLLIGVVLCITAIVIVGAFTVVLRLPHQIGRGARRATHDIASKAVPLITHRKPISKRRRRQLSKRVVLVSKLIITLLPVVIILPPVTANASSLPSDVVQFIAATTAIITLLWFSAEYLIARWLHIPFEQLY